jgi:hypothetical protein
VHVGARVRGTGQHLGHQLHIGGDGGGAALAQGISNKFILLAQQKGHNSVAGHDHGRHSHRNRRREVAGQGTTRGSAQIIGHIPVHLIDRKQGQGSTTILAVMPWSGTEKEVAKGGGGGSPPAESHAEEDGGD